MMHLPFFQDVRGLNVFRISHLVDPTVLSAIGRNLIRLELMRPSKEVVDGIIEHCPNLQYLELDRIMEGLAGSLKNGLKRLAKLKLNHMSVRLGTDWEGN
jgi:hypothetical protein